MRSNVVSTPNRAAGLVAAKVAKAKDSQGLMRPQHAVASKPIPIQAAKRPVIEAAESDRFERRGRSPTVRETCALAKSYARHGATFQHLEHAPQAKAATSQDKQPVVQSVG